MTKSERKRLCPSCQEKFPARRKVTPQSTIQRREKKRLSRKELVASVRPVVENRAGGRCECCGRRGAERLEWDEFYGRRPVGVSVETTWMLCPICHANKTQNRPDRKGWDLLFSLHCRKYEYRFRPRLTKEVAARSAFKEGFHV